MTAVAVSALLAGVSEGQVSGVDRSFASKSAAGSNGATCPGRARNLDAGKLTFKLKYRIADFRGRQRTTHSGST